MKLILVRHGETDENVRGISQGHFDSKLNENGKRQAELVAKRLGNEKVDAIYTSDLSRAYETAVEIAKFHDCELIESKELRERNKGIYEGKPKQLHRERLRQLGIDYEDFDFDGGESFSQVVNRADRFYRTILEKHKDNTILCVAHGETTMALFVVLGKTQSDWATYLPRKNTAVSVVNVKDGKTDIELLNCDMHLRE